MTINNPIIRNNRGASVTRVGSITKDAESRFVGTSGKQVCNVTVALNDRYKNANGDDEEIVTWLKVAAWGNAAEVLSQAKKGMVVIVHGRMGGDGFTGKDGKQVNQPTLTVNQKNHLTIFNNWTEANDTEMPENWPYVTGGWKNPNGSNESVSSSDPSASRDEIPF